MSHDVVVGVAQQQRKEKRGVVASSNTRHVCVCVCVCVCMWGHYHLAQDQTPQPTAGVRCYIRDDDAI